VSPDGSRVVFGSQRLGVHDLYEKSVAGDPTETLLLASAKYKLADDWSPGGRFLLYTTGADLWALPLDGDRKPVAVARMPFSEDYGRFSPDGHWIAYQSDESGPYEIYVQPFPGPGAKTQVSTTGGTLPTWRRAGRELFYLANDRLMAVPRIWPCSLAHASAARHTAGSTLHSDLPPSAGIPPPRTLDGVSRGLYIDCS
jgi:Tol biopolymer transport system component